MARRAELPPLAAERHQEPTGNVNGTSSDLELVHDGGDQLVAMRFAGVTIPRNAVIVHAYVQFQVDESGSNAASLTIRGQAIDDAPAFTTSSYNLSSRARTTAAVSWDPIPWTTVGEAGADQLTPDLAPVIQEIVTRSGWSSGNALVILVDGVGKRTAEAFDGEPAGAPLLQVEYE